MRHGLKERRAAIPGENSAQNFNERNTQLSPIAPAEVIGEYGFYCFFDLPHPLRADRLS